MLSPAPRDGQAQASSQAGPDQLGNSSTEKDHEQFRSQQCALAACRY